MELSKDKNSVYIKINEDIYIDTDTDTVIYKDTDSDTDTDTDIEIDKSNANDKDKEINKIYTEIYTEIYNKIYKEKEKETNDCPICLCVLEKDDKSIITVQCCNNQFHTNCYLECMNIQKICPLCRAVYTTDITIPQTTQSQQSQQLQNSQQSYQAQPNVQNPSYHIVDNYTLREIENRNRTYKFIVIMAFAISTIYYATGFKFI